MDKLERIRRKVRTLPFDWDKIAKIDIEPSPLRSKKYSAKILYRDGKRRITHFGAKGMEDYLDHQDSARRANFRARFRTLYEKNKSNPLSGLAFSYPLLW